MAIAKVILNGETLMDVTSNTNATGNMLNGVVGTKNDGTSVTGNIATKTSSNLTVSGATVTAPAGYYAAAASKAVTTTTHPNPTATIASSTGVVTASHTQTTGYVTSGTTTGTLNLTTQAGKTVTPTESAQTAVASYRWTTGTVSVAAISSTYVGTGVARKSAADLTASGSTVTAPAGYYATAASKSVAAGSAFPPAVTITKNPTIGVNTSGVVTASYNGSSSITPTVNAGYISQGTAGTISTTGTSTYQLTSKAAATYYPSTADQTIASQRWLVGNQTIKSVTTSNLTASNIAQGVVVKVGDSSNASRIAQVTGTFVGGEDIPVFTAVYNNNNLTSLTCNKTYSECLALINNNDFTGKYILSGGGYTDESGMTGVADSTNNVLKYTRIFEGIPSGEIFYYSNGTLNYQELPETMQSLSVTSNGEYWGGLGQGKVYNYVNVDVSNTYTATISGNGNSSYCYVTYNGTKYYTNGNTFTYKPGDTLTVYSRGNQVTVNGDAVTLSNYSYTYTLPVGDITIVLGYSNSLNNVINIRELVQPTGTYSVTAAGTYNVYSYSTASVPAGSAFSPAVTITTNPTITIGSTTGVVTATYTGSSSITPTVTSGYISQGTAGTISTSGFSQLQLPSNAGNVYYPSTSDRTINRYQWLTGSIFIQSVTTSNLTAANIAEGVVVKVGDATNASRITQITGTHSGATSYTATISGNGNLSYCYVTYNGTKYRVNGDTFTYKAGDTLTIYSEGNSVTINGDAVTLSSYSYTYTLPVGDIAINMSFTSSSNNNIKIWGLVQPTGTYDISSNGTYNVYGYSNVSVNCGLGEYYEIYKGMANGATLYAGGYNGLIDNISYRYTSEEVSNWCNSLLNVKRNQLAGQAFSGSFYFNNVSFISEGGFAWPDNIGQNGTGEFYFPSCSLILDYAFRYNATIRNIQCLSCTSISASAFYGCSRLSTVSFPLCISIGNYAFYSCTSLTTASFPSCTSIGTYAFYGCNKLTTVSFPLCTSIGTYAFYGCNKLTTVSFPSCISIGNYAFSNCASLTTASFPLCTLIGTSAFYACYRLATINFPSCISIGSYAFQSCTSLTTANFPSCISIGNYAFAGCASLTTASFPACTSIGTSVFLSCTSLTTAIFPKCNFIGSRAFSGCTRLISLNLTGVSSVPTLSGANHFASTPLYNYSTVAGQWGSIYVPASLYSAFIAATGWSTYSSRIVSV